MKRPHLSTPTPPSAGLVPFSPMEQMEELTADVASSAPNPYCDRNGGGGNHGTSFTENNSSLEEALGINFHDSGGGGVQRELVAK